MSFAPAGTTSGREGEGSGRERGEGRGREEEGSEGERGEGTEVEREEDKLWGSTTTFAITSFHHISIDPKPLWLEFTICSSGIAPWQWAPPEALDRAAIPPATLD